MCSRSVGADRNREDKIMMKQDWIALALLLAFGIGTALWAPHFGSWAVGCVYGSIASTAFWVWKLNA